MAMSKKCIICEKRPRYNGSAYCHDCELKIKAEQKRKQQRTPFRYIVWKGFVVGLFQNGKLGRYTPEPVFRNPKYLPKGKTINLDTYCAGYDRDQIKAFKRAVRQCHKF